MVANCIVDIFSVTNLSYLLILANFPQKALKKMKNHKKLSEDCCIKVQIPPPIITPTIPLMALTQSEFLLLRRGEIKAALVS